MIILGVHGLIREVMVGSLAFEVQFSVFPSSAYILDWRNLIGVALISYDI